MTQTRTHQLEGRKREERVSELQRMAHHKRGLTCWRGGRGRSRLVSFKMQHNTNEDSPTGGEEEGGAGWFSLRLSHMSRDEVELKKFVKSQFHYDQLASPLVSYMSRNSPSSSLRLVSPCLQRSVFPSSLTRSSLLPLPPL